MRTLMSLVAVVVLAVVGGACDGDDKAEPSGGTPTTAAGGPEEGPEEEKTVTVGAELTGAAEAPDPGDPDGEGSAEVTLDADSGEVCFDVSVTGLDAPTGMHIHEAPEGEAGDVVIPLIHPESGDGSVDECIDAPKRVVERIASSPGDFYLNVHTGPYPGGAVRGQLG